MLLRLFLLFTLIPIAELALLLWIAKRTDWLFTLGLIITTGVVGAWLARREGLRCLLNARQRLQRGEMPADSLLDGLMILVAGALLITPGVLTDLVGFSLLVPSVRRALGHWLAAKLKARVTVVHPFTQQPEYSHDEILDAKVVDGPSEERSSSEEAV